MDSLARRQTEIVALAKAAGRLSVEDLASRFKLSPQTIRKDLAELSERGVLQRFHGGAIPASGSAQFGHDARRHLATGAKERVGLKAASLIPNGSSVLIYIGTTVEQVARALRDKRGLTVITNDINVVTLLMGYEQIEVIVAGGAVRHRDAGVAGDAAVDFLRQFRADYSLVGTPAIDDDGTLRGYDYREVKVGQAIMDCARKSILVADSTKFAHTAPVRIGHISEFDYLVSEAPPPPRLDAVCREHEVQVEIAE